MDYKSAGVDIEAGRAFVKDIRASVARTQRPGTISGLGGFGGLFALPTGLQEPVLVSGTDGVGTKLRLAQLANCHDSIGIDLVAMCANDVLTLGAEPLFFLDYIATGQLDRQQLVALVDGIATGCEQAGCALLGGETAEMPGFYAPSTYDIAGFCVGIVERQKIVDGSAVQLGDRLIALPSSGVHSNGYSLVRRIVEATGSDWQLTPSGWGRSLLETFLTPTQIYVRPVLAALAAGLTVRGMAHITGGGLPENLPRCLGEGLAAQIRPQAWTPLPEFAWLQAQGQVESIEMFNTFNMGVGFVLVVPSAEAEQALQLLPQAFDIGEVVAGDGQVLGLVEWD